MVCFFCSPFGRRQRKRAEFRICELPINPNESLVILERSISCQAEETGWECNQLDVIYIIYASSACNIMIIKE